MAYETTASENFSPTPANMRGVEDFDRAERHSKLVAALRKVLPLTALAIVGLFIVTAITTDLKITEVIVDEVGLREGKLVMDSPKMAGFNKNSRPYDVQAEQAIQDLAQPGKVLLREIDAKLPFDATSFANIEARSGVYDTSSEKLVLDKEISIKGARGMDMLLEHADIDIRTGTMATERPVTANSTNTNISADSMRVEDGGDRIVFNRRVKMTINRPTQRGTGTTADQNERQ